MFSDAAIELNMIALALTPAVVVISGYAAYIYWPHIKGKPREEWGPVEYVMIGSVICFVIPGVLNVTWWSAHFLAVLYGWSGMQHFTWEWGNPVNIPTRYLAYDIGAHAFLFAAFLQGVQGVKHPRVYALLSIGLTVVTYTILRLTAP